MIAFNTFLVTLGGTAAIAAGVFILLVVTETVPSEVIPGGVFDSELGAMAEETGAALWTYAGVALALIAAGMAVLAWEFRHLTRAATPGMLILSSGAEGTVRLSLESVRELAERTAQGNRSVQRIRCGVQATGAGIRIRCSVGLRMGTDVPTASSAIQHDMREVVERLIGIPVLEVAIRARYLRDREQALLVR